MTNGNFLNLNGRIIFLNHKMALFAKSVFLEKKRTLLSTLDIKYS